MSPLDVSELDALRAEAEALENDPDIQRMLRECEEELQALSDDAQQDRPAPVAIITGVSSTDRQTGRKAPNERSNETQGSKAAH